MIKARIHGLSTLSPGRTGPTVAGPLSTSEGRSPLRFIAIVVSGAGTSGDSGTTTAAGMTFAIIVVAGIIVVACGRGGTPPAAGIEAGAYESAPSWPSL